MKSNLLFAKKGFLIIVLLICFNTIVRAQTIKGNVTDAKNGEILIGATVHIEKGEVKLNTNVKLDGSYIFKNVPAGSYTLQVKYLGYRTTKEYTVEVTASNTAILNIAMADNTTALSEVTIIEHASRESDKAARGDEKNSNNIINAVSAQAIAISPDVLVANVLTRVSGISTDKSNTGDAQHVIIRGMDKQYNTVLINGVKIPSPDNRNRYVPLDMFPAELVEKIDVYKSLTANMEGDASGGVVDLIMKTAPDKLKVEGYFGTGYSQLFFDRSFSSFNASTVQSKAPGEKSPGSYASISDFPYQNLVTKNGNPPPNADASLTIGDRFLNNKLGVVFSGTYRNDYSGSNSFELVQTHTVGPAPDINGINTETYFQDSYNRKFSSQLNRIGTVASLDYKFDNNNSINLFGTYLQLDEHRVRQTEDLVYGGYSYQGYHYTNEIDNLTETRTDLQSIYNFTLKGKHKITKTFWFDWTLADSKATHKQPDIAEFKTGYNTSPAPNSPQEPTPGSPGSSTTVATSVMDGPVYVHDESRVWTHNTDKDLSAYLNLHYDTKIFGRTALFSAGGMIRHKTRDNFVDTYGLNHGSDPGSVTSDEVYVSIPASTFRFNSPDYALGTSAYDAGVYTFTENIKGAYGMLKYLASDRLDFILGVRTEHTYQHYYSLLDPSFAGKTATITYTDYLPSINAKYKLTDKQAIRASYFESILRPAFADLIPYGDQTNDNYTPIGNYNLQHTTIDNFDLRYESFPGVFDEFLFGAFYKYLINPIEQQFTSGAQIGSVGSGEGLVLEPVNLGNAHNYGFEFSGKKFFGDIGFGANYTYTHSLINSIKRIDVINVGPIYKTQSRPLQGQASNIGNVSLLYKNTKNGIDAQLALAYTGERIQAVSQYYGLDTWEKATVNLDFSAQKQFSKHWIVFVKVNNILNTPYELFIKQNNTYNYSGILKYPHQESPNYTTVQYDQYYARYNLGVRFNF